MSTYGPWVLSIIGIVGFMLAGRKIWWAWYVNLACQVLWIIFSVATQQYGFLAGTVVYIFVFSNNAWMWTKQHRNRNKFEESLAKAVANGTYTANQARAMRGIQEFGKDQE